MKFSKFSGEMVAELLEYFAEHEKFPTLKNFPDVSLSDLRETFEELAAEVRAASGAETIVRKSQLGGSDLSINTNRVISKLSPKEEEILLKTFKIS